MTNRLLDCLPQVLHCQWDNFINLSGGWSQKYMLILSILRGAAIGGFHKAAALQCGSRSSMK